MNEELLSRHREDPRPEFANELYERISRADAAPATSGTIFGRVRWAPIASAAALVLGVSTLVVSPTARAAAQDLLDMFRVKRFAAISIDPARIEQLRNGRVDIQALLGDSVEVVKDPGPPVAVGSTREASERTGLPLLVPTYLYNSTVAPKVLTAGPREVRVTANAERLQGLVDVLGMDDVQVPQELDGATVTVRVPASVAMRYEKNGGWVASFVQAESPEVDLPQGVDIRRLGEIGLRIAGLSPTEARTFSDTIDWNSTLLVPVPANAASFREVNVRGTQGLMIEIDSRRTPQSSEQAGDTPRSILLWSEGNKVYSIASTMHPVEVLEMANSLQNE